MDRKIKVGLTEAHGMSKEISQFPAENVEYCFLPPVSKGHLFLKSPIKGYFRSYDSSGQDLIEAVLSPVHTRQNWIYSIANFQEALAFSLLHLPIPRPLRIQYMLSLFKRDNFKKLIFWSQAGKESLHDYGEIADREVLNKVTVCYPAIRKFPDHMVKFNKLQVKILFSGDFFRKGGASVVDAFQKAGQKYKNISLQLCCSEALDFNTEDNALRQHYLKKIKDDSRIVIGRVTRGELINTILPETDIFVSPTYYEAFGFAILEAMAFGIPVISTNHFAIPEMIEHEKSGFLIDIKKFDTERLFKGYVVNRMPEPLLKYTTDRVYHFLCKLIDSSLLREEMGMHGLKTVREKFSIEKRNREMNEIYHSIVGI